MKRDVMHALKFMHFLCLVGTLNEAKKSASSHIMAMSYRCIPCVQPVPRLFVHLQSGIWPSRGSAYANLR